MDERNIPTPRPASQSLIRETAPVLLLGAGLVGGAAWSLATKGALTSAPPYMLSQTLLSLIAFVLATRGAPRWSYPWLAFGIAGTQAVLHALFPPGDDVTSSAALAVAIGGPILAALVASSIAVRSWGDAAVFIGLYLGGVNLGLPIVLRQPEAGPLLGIEASRLGLLLVQIGLTGVAVLAWNRRATGVAIGALAGLLVLSTLAAGLLVPRSGTEVPEDFGFGGIVESSFRLLLLLSFLTFAVGSVRRVFAGQSFLSMEPFATATGGDDEAEPTPEVAGEETKQRPPEGDEGRRRRRSPADAARAPRRRRRRRGDQRR